MASSRQQSFRTSPRIFLSKAYITSQPNVSRRLPVRIRISRWKDFPGVFRARERRMPLKRVRLPYFSPLTSHLSLLPLFTRRLIRSTESRGMRIPRHLRQLSSCKEKCYRAGNAVFIAEISEKILTKYRKYCTDLCNAPGNRNKEIPIGFRVVICMKIFWYIYSGLYHLSL